MSSINATTVDEVIASLTSASSKAWWESLAKQEAKFREHWKHAFDHLADKSTREIDERLSTQLHDCIQRKSKVIADAFGALAVQEPELLPKLPRLDGRTIDPQAAADAVLEVVAALMAKRKEQAPAVAAAHSEGATATDPPQPPTRETLIQQATEGLLRPLTFACWWKDWAESWQRSQNEKDLALEGFSGIERSRALEESLARSADLKSFHHRSNHWWSVHRLIADHLPELLGQLPPVDIDHRTVDPEAAAAKCQAAYAAPLVMQRQTPAAPVATQQSGVGKPTADIPDKPNRKRRDPDQPSKDRQSDILAAIRNEGMPLQRGEIANAMRLETEGKLGHNLAWMVQAGILVNVPSRGYWPAETPIPE